MLFDCWGSGYVLSTNVRNIIVKCLLMDLFVCVPRPIDSEVIKRRLPHLLSLAKDVKLGKYTVPTGNRTRGRRATAAPPKLHSYLWNCKNDGKSVD